jgi:acyl dehydratase
LPAHFEDIEVGQVVALGSIPLSETMMESFNAVFAPRRDLSDGACEALVYSIWSSLDDTASAEWPQTKRLAVDALRWGRIPPAGDTLRGRMTVMGKDPVGAGKGIVFAQHDLLDQAGRLVFSCLTRSLFACREAD